MATDNPHQQHFPLNSQVLLFQEEQQVDSQQQQQQQQQQLDHHNHNYNHLTENRLTVTVGRDKPPQAGHARLRLKNDLSISRFHASFFTAQRQDELPQQLQEAGRDRWADKGETEDGEISEVSRPPQPPVVDLFLVDHASTHGSFVNGIRLSAQKTASLPLRLCHRDLIEFGLGKVTFQLHLHSITDEYCLECEDILADTVYVSLNHPGKEVNEEGQHQQQQRSGTISLDEERRAHNRKLKHQYGLFHQTPSISSTSSSSSSYSSSSTTTTTTTTTDSYNDRAKKRRLLHQESQQHTASVPSSSSSSSSSTATSANYAASDNKGAEMLKKMGWVGQGHGLGRDGGGIAEPIQVKQRKGRMGLGSNDVG